jgi:hypothetical protein
MQKKVRGMIATAAIKERDRDVSGDRDRGLLDARTRWRRIGALPRLAASPGCQNGDSLRRAMSDIAITPQYE